MNIVFTPQSYKDFEKERKKANKGCYICPCCGEYRQAFCYDLLGKNTDYHRQGIDIHTERRRFPNGDDEGSFTFASVDCFYCHTCRSMWESEPFDFDDSFTKEGTIDYGDNPFTDDDDEEWIFEIDDDE